MRRVPLTTIAAMLPAALLLAAPVARGRDVVQNGGFEHGGEDGADGWSPRHFAGAGRIERIQPGIEGDWALRLSVTEPEVLARGQAGSETVAPLGVVQDVVPPPLGEVVTLRVLARSEAPEGHATARIESLTADGQGVLTARQASWSTGEGLRPQSLSLYVPPEAARLRISLDLAGAGAAIFDGLRTETSPAPVFAPGVNALVDPGFEEGSPSWVPFGREAGSAIGVVPEAARSGTRGLRLESTTDRLVTNMGQEVLGPSFSNADIVVNGWFRARQLEGRGFLGVYFAGIGPDGKPFTRFQPFEDRGVSGDTGWTELRQRISLRGLAIHAMVVRACLRGKGALDVDDLDLRIEAPPSTHTRTPWSLRGVVITAAALGIAAGLLARLLLRRPRRSSASP